MYPSCAPEQAIDRELKAYLKKDYSPYRAHQSGSVTSDTRRSIESQREYAEIRITKKINSSKGTLDISKPAFLFYMQK